MNRSNVHRRAVLRAVNARPKAALRWRARAFFFTDVVLLPFPFPVFVCALAAPVARGAGEEVLATARAAASDSVARVTFTAIGGVA